MHAQTIKNVYSFVGRFLYRRTKQETAILLILFNLHYFPLNLKLTPERKLYKSNLFHKNILFTSVSKEDNKSTDWRL